MLGCVSSCLTVAHLGFMKNILPYEQYTCLYFDEDVRLRLGAVIPFSFFFSFLVTAQLTAHLYVSASGSLWNTALACLSLSDASSVFTVFLSKCHIRLPSGWRRSPRVQFVGLCLDRLSQTFFWGGQGETCLSYKYALVCTCIYTPGNYRAQAFLKCHYRDWSLHPSTFTRVWRTLHPCTLFYCLTCTHSEGNAGVTVPADSGRRWRFSLDKSQVDIERWKRTGKLRVASYPDARQWTVDGRRKLEKTTRPTQGGSDHTENQRWDLRPSRCEATPSANCATMSPYHLAILIHSAELNKK